MVLWGDLEVFGTKENFIEGIASIFDDPSDGMTLENNTHFGFDQFAWSLKEVPNSPNTYRGAVSYGRPWIPQWHS